MASPRELFQRAYKASNENDYDLAEMSYRKALDLDPKYGMAWNNLGWILYDQKQQYNEAENCYNKAITLEERNFYAWNNLGILNYRQKKNFQKAEECWIKATELNPEFAKAWSNLGVLYKFQKGDLKKSKECSDKAQVIILNRKKSDRSKENGAKKCAECGNMLEPGQYICDLCGKENSII